MKNQGLSYEEQAREIAKLLPPDATEEEMREAIESWLEGPVEIPDVRSDPRLVEPISASKKVFMGKRLPAFSDDYYDLLERMPFMESDDIDAELTILADVEPQYVDPLVTLAEHCFRTGRQELGEDFTAMALETVLDTIVDKKGRWPAKLEWGFLENRHLMRGLTNAAYMFWALEEHRYAITIFSQVLRMNTRDNQGIRFALAAILDGMSLKEFAEAQEDLITESMVDRVIRMTNQHPDRFPFDEEDE